MNDFELIANAAKQFPKTFNIRALPGKECMIATGDSYVTAEGIVYLYVYFKTDNNEYVAFAKGTVEELKREIV
jgi:hypothetical protein